MSLAEYVENSPRQCVLVLGSHRAGTSVLAQSLAFVGVELGGRFVHPRLDNPKGFFEDQATNEINEAFLRRIGIRWDSLIIPPNIDSEAVVEYQFRIKNEVCSRFSDKELWGLKDPRISRLWRFWRPVFAEVGVQPVFILANRHPFSVAQSLTRRDNMPKAQALALWACHQLSGLDALSQFGGLVVDYDLMMNSPRQELIRIASFLGTGDRLNLEEITRFERDFLSKELRHSQFFGESAASPLQSICLDLHARLFDFANNSGGLDEGHIGAVRELLNICGGEIAKSIEWMHAIDDLQTLRCKKNSDGVSNEVPLECETRLYLSEIVEGIPQGYTESRGATALYPISKQRQTIRLSFPTNRNPIARIRLDLANCQVALWLHYLALEKTDGSVLWTWNGDMLTFVNVLGLINRQTKEGLLLLSLNDDPQFDLAVPSDVLANLPAKACLVIELTPYPLSDVISAVLRKDDCMIEDLRADLSKSEPLKCLSLSAPLDTLTLHLANDIENISFLLKNTLDRRDQIIADQTKQLNRMREELLRAEAQLDLLKDVMLRVTDEDQM